ncbi:sulfite exporter TauE/SafE family protein [Paenibacillus humicola]|uniref:sulfite exporter TauE/SafE family protein n=1 Tax=Paenibacillus humicola TaxID=3110540 RepID=UPI00237B537A|nr:sulfite exporter TauE/SafE family protein [Paenibacillus humicola]
MAELSLFQIAIVLAAALCCGFAKTGIATLGIFNAMLMTQVFPAKEAVGTLLPMLIAADLAAVILYRRHVVWKHLVSLAPWVLIGLGCGYALLYFANDGLIRRFLGIMLLVLIAFQLLKDRAGVRFDRAMPKSRLFTSGMGVLAGFATMIGNVSGVVMSIYLLGKKLPKEAVVGTGAWFYLAVNLIKVPFFVQLGMITGRSLSINAWTLPVIAAGTLVGAKVVPRIRQSAFQTVILVIGAVGAAMLVI